MPEPTALFQESIEDGFEPDMVELEDGTFDFAEDQQEQRPSDSDHYDNLVGIVEPDELKSLGQELVEYVDADIESRKDWLDQYKNGLKTISPEAQNDSEQDMRSSRNLTKVQHPMILQAAIEFQARAIAETMPAQGPCKTRIIGNITDEKEDQAERIKEHMNYQILEEMPEYEEEHDRLLFHLPLVGMAFKKVWHNPTLKVNESRFIEAEDFIVHNGTTDLQSASRYTQQFSLDRASFGRMVTSGFYAEPDHIDPSTNDGSSGVTEELEGIEKTDIENDIRLNFYEVHIDLELSCDCNQEDKIVLDNKGDPEGTAEVDIATEIEDESPESEEKQRIIELADAKESGVIDPELLKPDTDYPRPYIVTVDKDTRLIVSIKRNWKEDDELFKKRVWFVPYRFLPGMGFYGLGLYHTIGGLGAAATGALRSLLDAAAYSNMQGGFKLKGNVRSKELAISPGEFVDIDAPIDDISKAIMPLPFKEPSSALFSLLGFIVDAGKSFIMSSAVSISDANQNTPVGTTVALLEEGARVFTAVHKRLHRSMKKEMKLIGELNYEYMDDEYPFEIEGSEQTTLRSDYDGKVDIIPVSDPRSFSSTQRIAQAQSTLSMAQSAPDLYDMRKVHQRMHQALQTVDYDDLMPERDEVVRLDAVAENTAMLEGKPISAYIDQDHMAHMIVLDGWFGSLPPPAQPMFQQIYMDHRAQHMSMLYTVQMQQMMGMPLQPPVSAYQDKDAKYVEAPAEADMMISQAAAQLIQQVGPTQLGPPLPGQDQQGQDPQAQLIAAETARIEAKGQADLQVTNAKAQNDMAMKVQDKQLELQLQSSDQEHNLSMKEREFQLDGNIEMAKLAADIETMRTKALVDIQIAQDKATADIEAKLVKAVNEAQLATAKAEAKVVNEFNGI